MTAVVILNVVFGGFVLVAIFSLLGGAIIADRRARARLGLTAWSSRSRNQRLSVARQSSAPAAAKVADWPTASLPG